MELHDDEEVMTRDVCDMGNHKGAILNGDDRVMIDHLSKVEGRGDGVGGSERRSEDGGWYASGRFFRRCDISMKIISYNIRGLGGVEKRKKILNLNKEKKHVLVFKNLKWRWWISS
jgi:hypothetical protein